MSFVNIALIAALLQSQFVLGQVENSTSPGGIGTTNDNDVNGWAFWRASQSPTKQTKLSFPGISMNDSIITNGPVATTETPQTWKLQLNFSRVTTQPGSVDVANLVYGLEFPEGQLPLNSSDWQICASLFPALPSSVSSHHDSSGDGNCVPYLGQACVNAIENAVRRDGSGPSGCLSAPPLSSIPECGNPAMTDSSTGVISNITAPGIRYQQNDTYTNFITTQYDIQSPLRQGLISGQAIGYETTAPSTPNNADKVIDAAARALHLVVLSANPSPEFLARAAEDNRGYARMDGVRMICGRVDSSEGSDTNGASSVFDSVSRKTATMLAAVCFSLSMLGLI